MNEIIQFVKCQEHNCTILSNKVHNLCITFNFVNSNITDELCYNMFTNYVIIRLLYNNYMYMYMCISKALVKCLCLACQ